MAQGGGTKSVWRVLPVALDGVMAWAVGAFALWTIAYHLALAAPLDVAVLWWAWAVLATALAVVLVRFGLPWKDADEPRPGGHGVAFVLGLGAAALSSCLVRPDLDDASYMVRSTWVAARGVVNVGDVIFSDGRWPALGGQSPYLPSFESLFGMTARMVGVSAASLVYVAYVPVGAFGAVWALWCLLRAWRARRAALALVVASVFLCWNGPLNASWGNFSLGRIWQGKVTMLAIGVPLLYAWTTKVAESRPGRARTAGVALVGALGIATAGLSPAAVFVVPEVLAVTTVAGVVARRGRVALVTAIAGALYPLGCGLVAMVAEARHRADGTSATITVIDPWVKTIGTGAPALVVALAALVALVALVVPRLSGLISPVGRAAAGVSALAGIVVAVPYVFRVIAELMGTDAIAWRAVWVVPVPALIGALAVTWPTARAWFPACAAAAMATALVLTGTPLWSAKNGASLAAPGSLKIAAADLDTARWIIGRAPKGRYLAQSSVVSAVGTLTAELAPVGTRPDYVQWYVSVPGAQAQTRSTLQAWVDGVALGVQPPSDVAADLDALDVDVVCGPDGIGVGLAEGWAVAYRSSATCWVRR